jgi:plasmid maintenance system antidote protein VapI
MDDTAVKTGMKPSHPGEFIREEILNELGLSVPRRRSAGLGMTASPCGSGKGKST